MAGSTVIKTQPSWAEAAHFKSNLLPVLSLPILFGLSLPYPPHFSCSEQGSPALVCLHHSTSAFGKASILPPVCHLPALPQSALQQFVATSTSKHAFQQTLPFILKCAILSTLKQFRNPMPKSYSFLHSCRKYVIFMRCFMLKNQG